MRSASRAHPRPVLRPRPLASPWAAALAVVLAGCGAEEWPGPEPVSLEQLTAEHAEWRADRRDDLASGAVSWIGLWTLPEGETPFGSEPGLPIELPAEDAPPRAGTLVRTGQEVRLEPAPGAALREFEGGPVTGPLALASDRTDDPTVLGLGSLGMRVHGEPGTDRLWLRVWDEDHPAIETFALPESYPVDASWRVTARFEPYPVPRPLPVADVTSGMIEYEAPGELVFHAGGEEHRLVAIHNEGSSTYFIMMWDSTAVSTTYQGGRYMRVPLADEEGWTTIDFNRAYNPPCAFTPYSVCGIPPRENWLTFAVTAGEKRPEEHAY